MKRDPISPEMTESMNELAVLLDGWFNPGKERNVGFALLVYNLGEDLKGTGRINYIGNGNRDDVLIALKELIARWEGRYAETDIAQ